MYHMSVMVAVCGIFEIIDIDYATSLTFV